jgi:23S rRNA pseudouridine1911/1915/1917 synthase
MSIRQTGGKHAASNWEVLKEFDNRFSLVKITIETGRTHQIRVHMAYLGYPVVGDKVYGAGKDNSQFPRQLLHASRLVFHHPVTGASIDKRAALWPDFKEVLDGFDGLGAMEEQE